MFFRFNFKLLFFFLFSFIKLFILFFQLLAPLSELLRFRFPIYLNLLFFCFCFVQSQSFFLSRCDRGFLKVLFLFTLFLQKLGPFLKCFVFKLSLQLFYRRLCNSSVSHALLHLLFVYYRIREAPIQSFVQHFHLLSHISFILQCG